MQPARICKQAIVSFTNLRACQERSSSRMFCWESTKKAEDETRTRDILLGRQKLYQLSYFRLTLLNFLEEPQLVEPIMKYVSSPTPLRQLSYFRLTLFYFTVAVPCYIFQFNIKKIFLQEFLSNSLELIIECYFYLTKSILGEGEIPLKKRYYN